MIDPIIVMYGASWGKALEGVVGSGEVVLDKDEGTGNFEGDGVGA